MYVVDRRHVDHDGNLKKTAVVDLTDISDPHRISLPAIHDGDIGIGKTFSRGVRVHRGDLPAAGQPTASRLRQQPAQHRPQPHHRDDDNEFIVVNVPGLLNS